MHLQVVCTAEYFLLILNMTLIITPKNKKQEKIVKAFLNSLEIGFHSEAEEDAALYTAMQKGRKTPLLNNKQKNTFLHNLKQGN
jgi:hypothetical protein